MKSFVEMVGKAFGRKKIKHKGELQVVVTHFPAGLHSVMIFYSSEF